MTLITETNGVRKDYSVATIKLGEPIYAAITVRHGKVRAEVAGQLVKAPIVLEPGAEVLAGCSTGQFVFEKLEMTAAS